MACCNSGGFYIATVDGSNDHQLRLVVYPIIPLFAGFCDIYIYLAGADRDEQMSQR